MSRIIAVTVEDGIMRTTFDDNSFNEVVIPKGYKLQVRIVPESNKKKDVKHYKYANCSAASKSVYPVMVYSLHEVTCKICQAIGGYSSP